MNKKIISEFQFTLQKRWILESREGQDRQPYALPCFSVIAFGDKPDKLRGC